MGAVRVKLGVAIAREVPGHYGDMEAELIDYVERGGEYPLQAPSGKQIGALVAKHKKEIRKGAYITYAYKLTKEAAKYDDEEPGGWIEALSDVLGEFMVDDGTGFSLVVIGAEKYVVPVKGIFEIPVISLD